MRPIPLSMGLAHIGYVVPIGAPIAAYIGHGAWLKKRIDRLFMKKALAVPG